MKGWQLFLVIAIGVASWHAALWHASLLHRECLTAFSLAEAKAKVREIEVANQVLAAIKEDQDGETDEK